MSYHRLSLSLCPSLVGALNALLLLPGMAHASPNRTFPAQEKPQKPGMIRLQAEDARLTGTVVAREAAGFQGSGYVTGWDQDGDKASLQFQAQPGLYVLRLRYRSPSGDKGCDITINGARISGTLKQTTGEGFRSTAFGKVELRRGSNLLEVEKGWGYYDLDALELTPAPEPPRLLGVPGTPVNPSATPAARTLLRRLIESYGKRTLSGQQEIKETEYVTKTTGVTPTVLGVDLMDYSPSRVERGSHPEGSVERWLEKAREGHVLTVAWHWNAPTGLIDKMLKDEQGREVNALWYRGFYTNATTFDVEKALKNPSSPEYKLLLRDMDAIAVPLKKLAKAGIPVLFRPLHEAEGRWFWWGAKGPEPLKQLWRLLYERLTHHHKLNNLLWVFTSGTDLAWYPGDKYVDIIGVDAYPPDYTDPLSASWDARLQQYNGRKLLALTEFGKVPDIAKMRRFGVRWAYFVSWTGDLGPEALPPAELSRLYRQGAVLHRAEWRKPR